MMTHRAAGDSAQDGVMMRIMARDGANGGAFEAARGFGVACPKYHACREDRGGNRIFH
jgi:hypothetical protein